MRGPRGPGACACLACSCAFVTSRAARQLSTVRSLTTTDALTVFFHRNSVSRCSQPPSSSASSFSVPGRLSSAFKQPCQSCFPSIASCASR